MQDADARRGESAHHTPTKRESFEQFVVSRSARLLATAYLLTQDRALAEDLLQTALAKSWSAWHRIDSDPEAYVRRVMVNTYSTWWRRRWNGELPMAALPDDAHVEADGVSTRDVRDALARLPKRQRAAIVLRFFDDQTVAETARILGCSVGTIKSQVSKALARLRVDPTLAEDDVTGEEGP
jgi:RNA polymerase sigma-70 factor (sigma-E family)